jgi:hypothetical protein
MLTTVKSTAAPAVNRKKRPKSNFPPGLKKARAAPGKAGFFP